MQNREIADIFYDLADLLDIQGENYFKVRAYRNAARIIAEMGDSLEDMVQRGDDLSKLPGIGKKLSQKIQEIVSTGKLQKLENLRKQIPESLRTLLSIEGLGPKRVKILHDKLHITDPESLTEAAVEHKISKLPGFGSKTEETILKGLHLLKQEGLRYLFAEAEPIVKDLSAFLQKAPQVFCVEAAGSFRRKKETVGDIDILCTAKNPLHVISYFTTYKKILKVLFAGDTRSTVILKNGLQIDLRVVKKESYGSALHYFTGSKSHVIAIRKLAIKKGLKINEYGVFEGDVNIASRTEKEIYAAVNLPYIEPELRENRGEIEAAQRGELPQLITSKDIRGDLHSHTLYSDGMDSISALSTKAQSLGYEYIAITDHCATLAIVQGLDIQKARKQLQEIDELNAKMQDFRILKGIEVDILEDGSLGMEEEILKELDVVNAGIHSKFRLTKQEQTKRLLKAIQNPFVTGIAHPTGRLIGKRRALQLEMQEIFTACKDHNVYMEINAQPERLDLNDILIKEAKETGLKFSIATDAHASWQLNYMHYGLNQARRGWLEKKDVINTLPLKKLLQLLG